MEGRIGFVRQRSSVWKSFRSQEFQENEIWDVREKSVLSSTSVEDSSPEGSSSLISRQLPSAARMIPRARKPNPERTMTQQQSAPISIPDWSKIYRKSPAMSSSNGLYQGSRGNVVDVGDIDDGGDDDDLGSGDDDHDGDEDCGDSGSRLPPHEWLARKLARDQISSFSVREGVGRTLKGRDLCTVRHSILTKTGFI